MQEHICQECGKEYKSPRNTQRFCSPHCRQKNQRKRERKEKLICLYCGKPFHPKRADVITFCSKSCSVRYRYKDKNKIKKKKPRAIRYCKVCGKELARELKYCSKKCSSIAAKQRKPIKQIKLKEKTCMVCGITFKSQHTNAKLCSDKCRNYINNRRSEINRRHTLRANGKIDYSITLKKLIARDGGVCHICKGKVNTDTNINAPDYPSIDHLLPVAKGGTHTWDNIKLAHRQCNTLKRDREAFVLSDGQLKLSV